MVRKKSLCMFLVILLSFSLLGTITVYAAENIPAATSQFYINDFAGVIDDDLEKEMQERAVSFDKSTDGIQVVVTTVKNIGNTKPAEYAVEMYNQYGIGKNNMGVLIMLSVETRQIEVRLGDNMTKYISDAKAGRIIDEYGIPYFKDNDFSQGLYEMQKATIEHINGKVTTANNEVAVKPTEAKDLVNKSKALMIFGSLLIIALGVLSFFGITKYSKKRKEQKEIEEIERIKNSEIVREKDQRIETLEEKLSMIQSEKNRKIDSLEYSLKNAQEKLDKMESRKKRAIIAYPDIEEKIDTIFAQEKIASDKKKAFEVETYLTKALELECTRHNLQRFQSACDAFEGLTYEQMNYIPQGIISKLKTYYSKSFEEQRKFEVEEQIRKNKAKAAEVQALILTALSCSVSRHSLSKLTDACRAYDRLNSEQRKYVQADVNTLYSMKRKAERLQEEYEEEERRRRQREEERRRREREEEERRRRASSSSYSSFSGSHTGHGGHSSGHGAGRSF